MTVRATICEIIHDEMILLQYKRLDKFGGGKWNGPGGKLEPDESPYTGVSREVFEETGLRIRAHELRGVLDFYFGRKSSPDWSCYIFYTEHYSGKPKDLGEGELRWFNLQNIPYDYMWKDDSFWLPILLEGKKFKGYFIYDSSSENIIDYELNII
ncbi:NUDIX domain-containing protein [Candidatus Bathyarchaeota archaeon]|nr:NUDIX domain-containing protein [Candidatus Bathyarchaeota archaeon]